MRTPVTVLYPAADPQAAALAAELALELPLLTAAPFDGATITVAETSVHFRGVPQGQERRALVDVIRDISRGGGELSPLGRTQARTLSGELWVLTVPT
jgi:hypothetical protein